jgi:dihydroorotase-like cyclic amidohydrolase
MASDIKLFVAIYTDEDVHARLAAEIRERGFDAVSTFEKGNDTLGDEEQLEYAASQGRAILTHNQQDFAPLHEKWQREGREHAGIVLSPRIPIGELLHRILRLLDQVTADEMRNNLRHLSDFAERRKQFTT